MFVLKYGDVVNELLTSCSYVCLLKKKRENGEKTITVQRGTVVKAFADWLRYAAARVKKMVSVQDFISADVGFSHKNILDLLYMIS